MRQLHLMDMGNGVKLKVKVSETKEQRDKRLSKKREEEEFLSTLHCAKQKEDAAFTEDGFEMDDKEAACLNPGRPTSATTDIASPPKSPFSSSAPDDCSGPLSSVSGPVVSATCHSHPSELLASARTPRSPKSKVFDPCSSVENNLIPPSHFASATSLFGMPSSSSCGHCGKYASSKCAVCKTPYCNTECQKLNWQQHRLRCKEIARRRTGEEKDIRKMSSPESDAEPLKIAEDSDDEGFHVTVPDEEDLAELRSVLEHASLSSHPSHGTWSLPFSQEPHSPSLPTKPRSPHGAKQPQTPPHPESSSFPSALDSHPGPVQDVTGYSKCELESVNGTDSRALSLPVVCDESAAINDSPLRPHTVLPLPIPESGSKASPATLPGSSSAPRSPHRATTEHLTYSSLATAFDHLDYPPPSFSLSGQLPDTFLAYPTMVFSSNQLSIMPLSLQTKDTLGKLLEFEKTAPTSFIAENNACPGQIYGVVDKKGSCFRVELLKSCKLSCIDTGELITSSSSCLFSLPKEIASLSSLRVRAMLKYTTASGALDEGRKYLKSKVWGQVVRVRSPEIILTSSGIRILLCDMEMGDGSVRLNHLVCREGYATLSRSDPTNTVLGLEPPTSPQRSPTKATKPQRSGLLSKPLSSMRTTTSHTTQGPSAIDEAQLAKSWGISPPIGFRCVHYSNKVPFHVPPMEFPIYPTVVISPSIIWAQVVHENSHKLRELLEDMNSYYQHTSNASYIPKQGEICVARFHVDNMFYRAEVLRVNNNGLIDVFFVDYGNRETVKFLELRHIKSIFLTLPKQALRFSLYGIAPKSPSTIWSEDISEFIRGKIFQTQVQAEMRFGDAEAGRAFVQLMDPSNPSQSLNELLVQRGMAQVFDGNTKATMKGAGHSSRISIGRGSAFNVDYPIRTPVPGISVLERSPESLTSLPSQSPKVNSSASHLEPSSLSGPQSYEHSSNRARHKSHNTAVIGHATRVISRLTWESAAGQ